MVGESNHEYVAVEGRTVLLAEGEEALRRGDPMWNAP